MKPVVNYTLAKVIAAALSLLSLSTFTRLLGPSQYGHYVLVVNSASLLALIGFQWLSQCCAKFYFIESTETKEDLRLISELFQYLIILSCLAVFASLGIYLFYKSDQVYILIALLAAGLGLHELSLKHANIATKSSRFLIITTVKSLAFFAVGAITLYFYKSPYLLVMCSIFSLAIATPYFWKVKYWNNFPSFNKDNLKKYLAYSSPIIIANSFLFLIDTSDRYFLNHFYERSIVGIYSVNYDLVQFGLGSLISIISLLTIPMMFKSVSAGDHGEVKLNYDYINFLFVFLLYPSVWITVLFLDQIVTFTSGVGYVSGVPLLSLFLGSGLFFQAIKTCYFDPFFQAKGKTSYQLYVTLLGALVNIGANFILIPKFGMLGAGISTLISYASLCLFAKFLLKKLECRIPSINLKDFKIGVIITIVGFGILFFRINVRHSWFVEFIIFATIWFVILFFQKHRILKKN